MKNLPPIFVGSDAWKDPEELQAYVTECSDLTSEWKFLCKICCRPGKNRRDVRNHVESIHFPTMSVFLFKINFRPTWQVIFSGSFTSAHSVKCHWNRGRRSTTTNIGNTQGQMDIDGWPDHDRNSRSKKINVLIYCALYDLRSFIWFRYFPIEINNFCLFCRTRSNFSVPWKISSICWKRLG